MAHNTQTCINERCNNPAFNNLDECTLHCDKNDYSHDRNSHLLFCFHQDLEKYITQNNYNETFIFSDIVFPFRDSRDNFDYFKILKKAKEIHFIRCVFYSHSIDLFPIKIFYDECCFINDFRIHLINMLENAVDSIFFICRFLKNVEVLGHTENNIESDEFIYPLFSDCIFNKDLTIYKCVFKHDIFLNYDKRIEVQNIRIYNCIFNHRFCLNHSDIYVLEISDCYFLSKLEIKDSKIEKFFFENSNVDKVVDFFGSKISSFKIYKSIFSDFVGFENVDFRLKNIDLSNDNDLAIFKYTTFMSFVNFRGSTLYQGLDISNANFKESPNFFNAKILSNKNSL